MKTKNEYLKEQGVDLEKDLNLATYTKIRFAMEKYAKDYHKSEVKKFRLGDVSKSLPIKKYEIDFEGNVLAGIEISENTLKVFAAMNGYGDSITIENIKITEKSGNVC